MTSGAIRPGSGSTSAGSTRRASSALERFPLNLLTTQTHDAKRSADVRARIDALSSMPDEWAAHVGRWFELTDSRRDGGAPDDVERYFLFQTLVGAWPIAADRIEAYMEKALREAKRNTNWIEPNADWEEAVRRFCRSLYADEAFLADFEPFARAGGGGRRARLARPARAQAHRPRDPRHVRGRRARVPSARRSR